MIKTSWKKSLVVAGILTALCASAAFAAEQTAPTPPTMRQRVDNILHDEHDNATDQSYHRGPGRHWRGPMHPGPQLTEEQVQAREAKRAEWEKMTPEQRQQARDAAHTKWREERMQNMTPEEKTQFEEREQTREAKRAEWRQMTPEQRQQARDAAKAKWDSMSDSEKEAARTHFRGYYHADGDHYYEGHRKNHHRSEYRDDHYYRDGRGDCPAANCPW